MQNVAASEFINEKPSFDRKRMVHVTKYLEKQLREGKAYFGSGVQRATSGRGLGPSLSVAETQREKILALVGPQPTGWWCPHLGQAFSTRVQRCA